jgi:hypothetical protein
VCRRCKRGPLLPKKRGYASGQTVLVNCGRMLCRACYSYAETAGTLDQYPPKKRPAAVTAAEGERLKQRYPALTWRQIAAHMGVSYKALDKAREIVGRGKAPDLGPRTTERRARVHTPTFDLVDRGEL